MTYEQGYLQGYLNGWNDRDFLSSLKVLNDDILLGRVLGLLMAGVTNINDYYIEIQCRWESRSKEDIDMAIFIVAMTRGFKIHNNELVLESPEQYKQKPYPILPLVPDLPPTYCVSYPAKLDYN